MTGQIEGDKPSRLKEEIFPSLSLIAKELQFSELNRAYNTQYLLQIGQFSNKQQNPLPSHQFDCQWLNCFSLRGTDSKEKRLNTKNLLQDLHQMCTLEWSGHGLWWPEGMLQCSRTHGGCTLVPERVHSAQKKYIFHTMSSRQNAAMQQIFTTCSPRACQHGNPGTGHWAGGKHWTMHCTHHNRQHERAS